MLTTLIYQSKLNVNCSDNDLEILSRKACEKNAPLRITGLLLFNGTEFFQILEGEEDAVNSLFYQISEDPRHCNVVELLRDYSSHRRFNDIGMTFFNLQTTDKNRLPDKIRQMNRVQNNYLSDDRILRFINRFITEGGWYTSSLDFIPSQWKMVSNHQQTVLQPTEQSNICTFAFQAIVEPMRGRISSFEALIRDPAGKSPEAIFSSMPAESLYDFDLKIKSIALALAGNILRNDEKISINLLPGVLYDIPDSVSVLLEQIKQANLRPDQVIIEIVESELIDRVDDFYHTLKEIRVEGIGLAIDDFGSGYSRLSLLSKLQPEKLKLDRSLIQDIHKSAAKQSMVVAIIGYCKDMEINLVAEGVETLEEWCWLQSMGIRLFQGFLFSRPCANGIGEIYWPVRVS